MQPSESIDPKSHENHAARILRIGHAEGTFEREMGPAPAGRRERFGDVSASGFALST